MNVRIPFDSVAVIGSGDAPSDRFAEELAVRMAPARGVRVVPPQRIRAYDRRTLSAEEIGRGVHARCVAVCRVAATETALDVGIEVIDVLAERVVAEATFLVVLAELVALQKTVARWLARFLTGG